MNLFVLLIVFAVLIFGNVIAFPYINSIANKAARYILMFGVVLVDLIVIWQIVVRLGIPDVRV
jgi:hypothetical protein